MAQEEKIAIDLSAGRLGAPDEKLKALQERLVILTYLDAKDADGQDTVKPRRKLNQIYKGLSEDERQQLGFSEKFIENGKITESHYQALMAATDSADSARNWQIYSRLLGIAMELNRRNTQRGANMAENENNKKTVVNPYIATEDQAKAGPGNGVFTLTDPNLESDPDYIAFKKAILPSIFFGNARAQTPAAMKASIQIILDSLELGGKGSKVGKDFTGEQPINGAELIKKLQAKIDGKKENAAYIQQAVLYKNINNKDYKAYEAASKKFFDELASKPVTPTITPSVVATTKLPTNNIQATPITDLNSPAKDPSLSNNTFPQNSAAEPPPRLRQRIPAKSWTGQSCGRKVKKQKP